MLEQKDQKELRQGVEPAEPWAAEMLQEPFRSTQ